MVTVVAVAVTLVDVEVSVRARLGGRRAISWQAVVIGDLLIVVLATLLTIVDPGSRPRLDAATDVFAITMASAVVAAAYTGVAHLTLFRNRAMKPVPVPWAVGFHLSIGFIFLLGFALGAVILGVPAVGGTVAFSIAVLIGGLLVCLPTSLLLDDSDRYRAARVRLISRLAELERLRISEWSLRQALREMSTRIEDPRVLADLSSRLDVLDVSDRTDRSTASWWLVSLSHHRREPIPRPHGAGALPIGDDESLSLSEEIFHRIAEEHPPIRWAREVPRALTATPRFPVMTALLSAFLTLLVLSAWVPAIVAAPIAATTAVGVFTVFALAARTHRRKPTVPWSLSIAAPSWGAVSATAWILLNDQTLDVSPTDVVMVALACAAAVVAAVFLVGWSVAVITSRDAQIHALSDMEQRRATESAAIFASLTAVVVRMAETPPLSASTAIAACATGLQRVQQETDAVQARRIIDWTQSVVAAPGILPPSNLPGRLDEVIHTWRALADLRVDCPKVDLPSAYVDEIVAVVDEAVRNACRHGDAQTIAISIEVGPSSHVKIEVADDGVGLDGDHVGIGFARFASLGSAGFEVTPRSPGPGTLVRVALDPSRLAAPIER